MASPEHDFVSDTFIEVAARLARSEVYGYTEAARSEFDFACLLTQHRERAVVGQTLQRHAAGIEKDLNFLLHDTVDSLPVYLYSDTAKHVARIGDILERARIRLPDRVAVLRLFAYPSFDADNENERRTVAAAIENQVVEDLLMNVVFGRLSGTDIRLFLLQVGILGLSLALLETIAVHGFSNFPMLAERVPANPTTMRPRVANLVNAGMLATPQGASLYRTTQRGRVFLRICRLLSRTDPYNPELEYILRRLDLDPGPQKELRSCTPEMLLTRPHQTGWSEQRMALALLLAELDAAAAHFGVTISGGPYGETLEVDGLAPPPNLVWVER